MLRMKVCVEKLIEAHKGSTVLVCSHGGPVGHLNEGLVGTPVDWGKGCCGFTAFSIYKYEISGENIKWENIVYQHDEHLEEGGGGSMINAD